MEVGLMCTGGTPQLVERYAQTAEAAGFATLWAPEHVVFFEEYARAYRIPTISVRLLYVLLERRCRDEFAAMLANRGREDCVTWLGGYVMPQDVAEIIARCLTSQQRPEKPGPSSARCSTT